MRRVAQPLRAAYAARLFTGRKTLLFFFTHSENNSARANQFCALDFLDKSSILFCFLSIQQSKYVS